MTNEEYISHNLQADIRSLALKKVPEGVDALWCLQQIEGYQLALRKLPRWAMAESIWYPPRISMEQCSSESTALYKQQLLKRLVVESSNNDTVKDNSALVDITGGFGVDFSYMARGVDSATYVERNEQLCKVVSHNLPLLSLPKANVVNADAADFVSSQLPALRQNAHTLIVFADPARRDMAGRKTVAIEDCTPDIATLHAQILSYADYLIVKLSPMLDISQALRALDNVSEVHTVSVHGECKELLLVLSAVKQPLQFHCVNLDTQDAPFLCTVEQHVSSRGVLQSIMPEIGMHIFEPNASILKGGVQDAFAVHYSLRKCHPHSNLFFTDIETTPADIPARHFVIDDIFDFSKPSLKRLRSVAPQANITIRNFPSTVSDLRKRLKIKEGGAVYLFVTTLADASHAILLCRKV